jgi:CpeT protein|tara:strand:+ start:280 stop:900 length:621 start_codon:yes stop_codon:yes gene_type:complete
MLSTTDLILFAKTLGGIYDNLEQSQANPKDFARINIFFRPLPWAVFDGPGFYSEQCYDYAPWDPYRQGLHRLLLRENFFLVENYGYADFRRVAGAGRDSDLLKSIKVDNLKARCGCDMHFKVQSPGHYLGEVEPGKKCLVPRDGKMTYLVSEVEVDENRWISRDRGFDPESDEQCWGSEHGQLRFKRIQWLNETIQSEWISKLHKE